MEFNSAFKGLMFRGEWFINFDNSCYAFFVFLFFPGSYACVNFDLSTWVTNMVHFCPSTVTFLHKTNACWHNSNTVKYMP